VQFERPQDPNAMIIQVGTSGASRANASPARPPAASFAEAVERRARAVQPAAKARMNRVMMVEYDAVKKRWRDLLHRTPQRGIRAAAPRPVANDKLVRPGERDGAAIRASRNAEHGRPLVDTALDSRARLASAVAIGMLLMVCPPLAVTLAWTSPHISTTGKLALTGFGVVLMILAATVGVLVALSLR
jgi:hypothetical protein